MEQEKKNLEHSKWVLPKYFVLKGLMTGSGISRGYHILMRLALYVFLLFSTTSTKLCSHAVFHSGASGLRGLSSGPMGNTAFLTSNTSGM